MLPLHICLPVNHLPSTPPSALRVASLRYLWDTRKNTNNLAPVMLCQYRWTQDRCCYYFVISKFGSSWRTSEILLPCTRMSTNDRTVGKEQRICYHWLGAVMDGRAGEHPPNSRLQTILKVHWHSQCTRCYCTCGKDDKRNRNYNSELEWTSFTTFHS